MSAPRTTPVRPLLLLLVCAILVTAIPMVAGFVQTRRLAHLIVGGEVSRWRDELHEALQRTAPPPTDAQLAAVVASNRERGLRAAAVLTPEGRRIASGGDPSTPPEAVCGADQREGFALAGERVRVCAGALPPRRDGLGAPMGPPPMGPPMERPPWAGPPMGGPMMGGPPGFMPARRAPTLVFEFEPLAARDLSRAQAGLVAAGAVALLAMLALGVAALRLLGDREAIARRLAQARHLTSLGEMSAVLAHEIRNPLASLKGHAQLLSERLTGDAKLAPRAERVVTDATRLERLVDELLAFARTGSLDLREVQPEAWARGVVASVDGDVVVAVDHAPARWRLDPARLGEALANVVRNGLEAGDGGVTVRVAGARGALVIEVRDRGPGIAPGEEEAIFEPFHTRKVKGTGLGLAIARRTAALHGGTITARNHPDGGALFRFTLPDG